MVSKREIVVLIFILIGLSVFVYFADPTEGPIFPCIINKLTGLYCPGCGMTRAVHSVLRFEFVQAFRFNALLFIMPFLLIIYYVFRYKKWERIARFVMIIMIILALAYGILRNIPSLSYLSPSVIYNKL